MKNRFEPETKNFQNNFIIHIAEADGSVMLNTLWRLVFRDQGYESVVHSFEKIP